MIYPENFEIKIGFNRIRKELESRCISTMGLEQVQHLRCAFTFEPIHAALLLAEEFRQVMISGRPFPSQDYFDLRTELQHVRIQGTYLEPETLGALGASLRTLVEIRAYVDALDAEAFSKLKALIEPVWIAPWIPERIHQMVDDKAEVRDSASPVLQELRQKQVQQKRLVEKRIRLIYQHLKKEGVAGDEAEITIRNGRSVIPLPAANKRRIKGFIHDESATGQTVYMEPEEIFDLNNGIRELESAEKREIIRILTEFTDELRLEIPGLTYAYDILGAVDFLRAKTLLALEMDAVRPQFHPHACLDLHRAVNPLLFLSGKHKRSEVVPLDLCLDAQARILIISGPNAGGKSVCLKTTGLLQYMLQCGLLIPVREDSETGVFTRFFIEIGDEQSIENDLSTYSSHLKNIRFLTEQAGPGMLFLVDEFGSGTEPQPGGAIAEAVLETMAASGAWGVVTTHYLNLKLMAGKVEGIINGAMLFDTNKLKPLFLLSIGKPGSSFAFEIAAKTGLSKEILDTAAKMTGTASFDFEHQLAALDHERRELEQKKMEFDLADELLAGLIKKYSDLKENLETSRKKILEEARKEAMELLENTNRKIEGTIRVIKESQADKEKTKEAREDLQEYKEEVKTLHEKKAMPALDSEEKKIKPVIRSIPEKAVFRKSPLVAGGYARIRGQETYVEIAGIQGAYATVVRDNIRLKISLDQLEGCEKPKEPKKSEMNRYQSFARGLNEKLSAFETKIDLRGTRADELLPILQKFVDDALLLSVMEVHILHGKGNGVLRSLVREYLASVSEVSSYKDEVPERGGSGITVVKFR